MKIVLNSRNIFYTKTRQEDYERFPNHHDVYKLLDGLYECVRCKTRFTQLQINRYENMLACIPISSISFTECRHMFQYNLNGSYTCTEGCGRTVSSQWISERIRNNWRDMNDENTFR